jgi:hypothetical protein
MTHYFEEIKNLDCGCTIEITANGYQQIESIEVLQCPMHKHAAQLLEALEAIRDYAIDPSARTVNAQGMTIEERLGGCWAQAEAAIAAAEG